MGDSVRGVTLRLLCAGWQFNCTEFGTIKLQPEAIIFVLSTKAWIERTNAKIIIAKAGRYGGTYAHREKVYNPDFNYGEFATIRNQSGLNSFKISVKEFQLLKATWQCSA